MAESGAPDPTAKAESPRHGGDLAWATERYDTPDGGWLDLSTGINPIPYPAPATALDGLARLPGRDDLAALIAAARRAYGVPSGVDITAVPGSEIALRLLPLVAEAGTVAVVAPTYASHAEAWREAGQVVVAPSLDAIPDDVGFVVVGNPNNPDGRTVAPDVLAALARQLGARGGFLVVDEAFADVAPEVSLMPHLDGLPAVVLRSFGKFYGLAGLRLGFAAGAESIIGQLTALLGDWPVSAPAISIGRAALADDAWRTTTRARLKRDAARLHDLLQRHGLAVASGTDLFALVESDAAQAIHEALARRGIWTRIFDYEPRWLRLGLPPPDGFDRLERALAAVRR